ALAAGDVDSLLGLLASARVLGEQRDLTVVAARLAALPVADADQLARTVDALEQAGQPDAAAGLIEGNPRLLAGDAPLLLRASAIAERRGRLDDAVAWLQRAMAAYGDGPVALGEIRADHARLIALQARRAQASAGAVRDAATDAALAAAAAWRKLDPDNSAIDVAVSELLVALGRTEEAGRYLSTTIERHPLEGDSYRVVAEAYERDGEVERALPLWARAAEIEPTNPTWLLRQSQALAVVGRRAEAQTLLERIASGSWHSRFAGVVDQARRLRR
ncbi:MAG TPA: hypothetical protein VL172_21475, partial [Kofleriaceae bacterium]|nr:hypothetical protein [Kofleriaceae bacterium]